AKALLPQPVELRAGTPTRLGAIFFGSTSPAMLEAIERLRAAGIELDALRVRGYPFADSVRDFIAAHESVFVVEQNRDGQLRTLLVDQFGIDPARLPPVLHYDGTPITATFIANAIAGAIGTPVGAAEAAKRSA